MISHLSIKDFAIIEDLNLDLNDGLNIITGETGAGKSIIIEAISLALGARADTSYIRTGKEKALIQLIADYEGSEVIITREISSNGRNICKIDGQIVTLSQVQSLCSKIADIHGQYDHQSLLNPDNHIFLIDIYKKEEIYPLKEKVKESFESYKKAESALSSLLASFNSSKRQKDFMSFELNEIESANLKEGEDTKLEERIKVLQNSEKIYGSLESAYSILYSGEENISSLLTKSCNLISQVSSYQTEIQNAENALNDISYSLEDIICEIRNIKDQAVFDPHELDECIARLDLIDSLKRKYSLDIGGLLSYRDELAEKLLKVENIDEEKIKLEKEKEICLKELLLLSDNLTDLRKKSADELSAKILAELKDLNFKDAMLKIDFKKSESFSQDGNDIVEFMISTNTGEKLKPLSKVASGGEMSRIMLAFKKITGDYDKVPTMIFDEIDTGISGITASIVAKKLIQIADTHQIICITHLPQIAAAGTYNYLIKKDVHDNSTFTDVLPLDEEGKTDEIARLIGGTNITDTTRKSAKELIFASK